MESVKVNYFIYRLERIKTTFCGMRGPLGPYFQFWKGSHVEICIGQV